MTGDRRPAKPPQNDFSKTKLVNRLKVKEYIERWTIQFNRNFSEDEIAARVELYSQDLKNMKWTGGRFESAAIRVTQKCKFFPTVADLAEVDQQNQVDNARRDEQENRSYRYSRTEVETAHGKAQLKNIFDILEGKVTPAEGERRSWALLKKLKGAGK